MRRTGREEKRTPGLDSERLWLQSMMREDLSRVVPLANDSAVAPQTASMPYPFTLADAETWFDHRLARAWTPSERVFTLERKEDGAMIGAIGVDVKDDGSPAAMGFWMGRRFWGRGYMTEAVRRLLRHVFEDLDAEAVRAAAFPGNDRSRRLMERVGMRCFGTEIHAAPARGGDREVVVFELRREDWQP